MVKAIAAMALALVFAQDPPRQDKPGQDRPGQDRAANQDLDSALTKAAQMNNYTASTSFRHEGGREPGRDMGLQPVEFRVMPDLPILLKSGEFEAYRKGDVFIHKDGNTWKRFDGATDSKRSGDQPRGDQPKDQPKGDQPRGDQPQDKGVINADKMRSMRAPHEILRDLRSTSFKQLRREDGEGGRIFSGELTDEAVRSIMAHKRDVNRTPDKGQVQSTGTAKIWVNGEGVVTRYEINLDKKGEAGKTDEMGRKIMTTEFREVGSTKYEVPADAQKSFDSKTTDRKDRPTDKDKTDEKPSDKPMDEKKDDKKTDDR